ncbi:MAG: hypothetical protein EHM70_13365 [Chloroflexota bacterium]|nr:MAG: hypothetical protein EHM70_13365 [Chloroflexota bacterium]
MNIGMLWFDNDPKAELHVKIQRAASYYHTKYGQNPNLCFVHPSMVIPEQAKMKEIEVRTTRSVLPNHFWIGVNSGQGQPSVA